MAVGFARALKGIGDKNGFTTGVEEDNLTISPFDRVDMFLKSYYRFFNALRKRRVIRNIAHTLNVERRLLTSSDQMALSQQRTVNRSEPHRQGRSERS